MELLENLISAVGVSGSEESVRNIISEEMKPFVDKSYVDNLGNFIAQKKGTVPRVMLASHMDEVGLMIKNMDMNGRIYFSTVGSIDSLALIAQKVVIKGDVESVQGVITTKEMMQGDIINYLPKIADLMVDTGLTKKELDSKGVKVGSPISFIKPLFYLGSKQIISGKALDDRVGCYILCELAKRLKKNKNEIFYVFTVQEEVGLYGAKVSAYEVEPAYAIAVEVTETDEYAPMATKQIGRGPVITVKDAEMLGSKCINNWLTDIAKKRRIPIQYSVSESGTTDALAISLSKGGIPSTVVSVAVRNIHTGVGVVNKKDIENTIDLLEGLLINPPLTCIV